MSIVDSEKRDLSLEVTKKWGTMNLLLVSQDGEWFKRVTQLLIGMPGDPIQIEFIPRLRGKSAADEFPRAHFLLYDLSCNDVAENFGTIRQYAGKLPIVLLVKNKQVHHAQNLISGGLADDYFPDVTNDRDRLLHLLAVTMKRNDECVSVAEKLRISQDNEQKLMNALDELKFALASERVLLEELDKKNKDLVELSITDGLTGLYNHRYIQERFDFEFKRVKRYHSFLTCMMIDIDNFKQINDTHGHQVGDMVLREMASILVQNTREVDICGRYGGEEFLVINNQDAEGALMHASKLHKAIEANIFLAKTHEIHVTVSIGIAEYKQDIKTKQQMIERADMALYQAKKNGRNLIRVWKEQEQLPGDQLDTSGISNLKSQFALLSSQMRSAYMESMDALLKAVDAKDEYTLNHSLEVSRIAEAVARKMGFNEDDVEVVKYAALLHDIGKIGIDKQILQKKGLLTDSEFELLKKHPSIGVNIIKDVRFLEREIPLILYHHEWYNGSGYPMGLSGREIPIGAQIIAIADAYSAMSQNRHFRKKMSDTKILEEIEKQRGKQFSPEIIDVFMHCIK